MTTRFAKPDRAQPNRNQPLWRSFLAPMLLASLGLHGLILLLPAGSEDSAVIPPPDPEQDSVAITRVPPPGTADTGVAGSTGAPIPGAVPIPVNPAVQGATAQPGSAPQGRSPMAPPRQAVAPARSQPQPQSQRPAPSNPSPNPTTSPPSASAASPSPVPPPAPPSSPLFNAQIGEQLLAYVATLNLPQAQVDRATASIQNRFGYNAAAVTREAFNSQKAQWESTIQQETGLSDLTAAEDRTKFSTVYPQRVCLVDSPRAINIGALVNPDGTWRGEPTLLRSSGYGALDRKALQEIQSHRFASADGVRAYVLTVDPTVDYGRRPCLNPTPQS